MIGASSLETEPGARHAHLDNLAAVTIRFADLPDELADPATAEVVVLPLPYERTTSYGTGTAEGPEAILAASHEVELWDERLGVEPFRRGVATLPAFRPVSVDPAESLAEIEEVAGARVEAGKTVLALGGEHAVTVPLVRAARRRSPGLGVVQLDAHADLRESYRGSLHSHACVMKRLLDDGIPTLGVGIRALCREESELVSSRELPVIWGWELEACRPRFGELLATLPEEVYLTVDVDYFDPSLVPATGTPVPGGGGWRSTLDLLGDLFATKRVVGMDVVELAPDGVHHASDFLAASLAATMIALHAGSREAAGGE